MKRVLVYMLAGMALVGLPVRTFWIRFPMTHCLPAQLGKQKRMLKSF